MHIIFAFSQTTITMFILYLDYDINSNSNYLFTLNVEQRIYVLRSCPHGYTCLGDVGGNPNFGYTSFDNLLWSMLTTFQLITLDYWENIYNMVSFSFSAYLVLLHRIGLLFTYEHIWSC